MPNLCRLPAAFTGIRIDRRPRDVSSSYRIKLCIGVLCYSMRNTRSYRGGLTTSMLVSLRGSAVKIRAYAYSSRETYATWKPRVVAQLVLIVSLGFHRLDGMRVPLGPSGAVFIFLARFRRRVGINSGQPTQGNRHTSYTITCALYVTARSREPGR